MAYSSRGIVVLCLLQSIALRARPSTAKRQLHRRRRSRSFSAGVQPSTGCPRAGPSPARKSLTQPPASSTSSRPASASQELMCSSHIAVGAAVRHIGEAERARAGAPHLARRPGTTCRPSRHRARAAARRPAGLDHGAGAMSVEAADLHRLAVQRRAARRAAPRTSRRSSAGRSRRSRSRRRARRRSRCTNAGCRARNSRCRRSDRRPRRRAPNSPPPSSPKNESFGNAASSRVADHALDLARRIPARSPAAPLKRARALRAAAIGLQRDRAGFARDRDTRRRGARSMIGCHVRRRTGWPVLRGLRRRIGQQLRLQAVLAGRRDRRAVEHGRDEGVELAPIGLGIALEEERQRRIAAGSPPRRRMRRRWWRAGCRPRAGRGCHAPRCAGRSHRWRGANSRSARSCRTRS